MANVNRELPATPPPTHIVVCLDDDKSIRNVLSTKVRSLSVSKSSDPAHRLIGAESFAPRTAGAASTVVFDQFNIATAQLGEDEAAALKSEGVLVVRNERRTVLGWRETENSRREALHRTFPDGVVGAAPLEGSGHRVFPDGLDPNERDDVRVNLLAYLKGQKDLIDVILRQFGPDLQSEIQDKVIASSSEYEWPLVMLGFKAGQILPTGKGVKVAVLDTGLAVDHPDFVGRVNLENCASFVPGVASVQDGHGHGTHCCGVVAGPIRPQQGLQYGVAPDAELLVGKVLADDGGGNDSEIVKGIAWAAAKGAKVISMSLGSPRRIGESYSVVYEQVARKLAQTGLKCLLIAAAGNESDRTQGVIAPVGNPAACPSVFSVAAIDQRRHIADFSCGQLDNIGAVDVSAPGVSVRSSVPASVNRELYERMSGTSMATPHIAGLAALFLEKNQDHAPADIWKMMVQNAQRLGTRRDYGFGLVRIS